MTAARSDTGLAAGRRLEGRAAIVTGAGSGIGRATAERFVAEGARVLVADLSEQRARETCQALGDRAVAATVDVCDPDAVRGMIAAAVEAFGGVDVLHSNAGVAESVKPLADITLAEFEQVLAVNLTAFFVCAQAVAPVMRERGGGSVILTASIAARRPRPGMAAYVASKSGATGLARALAIELAPDRIRVNVVNPGPARTPMIREFGFAASEDEAMRSLGDALPLGGPIEPAEVAAAAAYLASDDAVHVTGLVLNVDAGRDL